MLYLQKVNIFDFSMDILYVYLSECNLGKYVSFFFSILCSSYVSIGSFQKSITRDLLISGRINVNVVSMEPEGSILDVCTKVFVLLCI